MKCRYCECKIPPKRLKCPDCGRWQTAEKRTASDRDGTVLLGDANIRVLRRIDVGPFSPSFGGGLASSSTVLLGGAPGAGKSTLSLQLADMVVAAANEEERWRVRQLAGPRDDTELSILPNRRNSGEVLVISAEQRVHELRNMVVSLGLKNFGKFRMMPVLEGFTDDVDEVIASRKPAMVICDSLPKFTFGDLAAGVDFAKLCKDHADIIDAPFIIIDHVTKENEIAGLQALQHEVDTTMTLFQHEPGAITRKFVTKKNRFGPDVETCLEMTAHGLVHCPGCKFCAVDDAEDGDADAAYLRASGQGRFT